MTYVGATPTTGDFKKLDSITTSSATTFNLRQGGVAVYPQSANHCIVSLNGVIQAPIDAFTIVNDTIVFASSLASSDVINFILVLGNVNDIGTVSDDTVSQAKIQSEMANPIYIDNQQQTSYTSGRDKFSYIKIGRLVHCFGYVDTYEQTLVDTGTVELSLPFPVSANSSNVQNTGVAFLNGYLNNKYWLTHIYLTADDTKSELNYAVGTSNENSAYYEGGGFSVLNTSHRLILTMSFTYNTDA